MSQQLGNKFQNLPFGVFIASKAFIFSRGGIKCRCLLTENFKQGS